MIIKENKKVLIQEKKYTNIREEDGSRRSRQIAIKLYQLDNKRETSDKKKTQNISLTSLLLPAKPFM